MPETRSHQETIPVEHVAYYPDLNVAKNLKLRASTFLNPRSPPPTPPKSASYSRESLASSLAKRDNEEVHSPMVTIPLDDIEGDLSIPHVPTPAQGLELNWLDMTPSSVVKKFFDHDEKDDCGLSDEVDFSEREGIEMVDLVPMAILQDLPTQNCNDPFDNRHKPRNSQIHQSTLEARNTRFNPASDYSSDDDDDGLIEYHRFQFSMRHPLPPAGEIEDLSITPASGVKLLVAKRRSQLEDGDIRGQENVNHPNELKIRFSAYEFFSDEGNRFNKTSLYPPKARLYNCAASNRPFTYQPYSAAESSSVGAIRESRARRGAVAPYRDTKSCDYGDKPNYEPSASTSRASSHNQRSDRYRSDFSIPESIDITNIEANHTLGNNFKATQKSKPERGSRARIDKSTFALGSEVNDSTNIGIINGPDGEISQDRNKSKNRCAYDINGLLPRETPVSRIALDPFKARISLSAVQPRQSASTAAVEASSVDIGDMRVSSVEKTPADKKASIQEKPSARKAHTSTVVAANKRTTFGCPPPAPSLFPPGFALQSEYTAAEVLLSMGCKNGSATSITPVHVVSTRVQRSSSWDGQAPLSQPNGGRRYTAAGCIRGDMR
ncbi:hypothetical protein DFP73DRAFT_594573 [Morchella snyderi]|nr:hypothetical protein DFP73DRAFT_594573 [Morchella snyderi]